MLCGEGEPAAAAASCVAGSHSCSGQLRGWVTRAQHLVGDGSGDGVLVAAGAASTGEVRERKARDSRHRPVQRNTHSQLSPAGVTQRRRCAGARRPFDQGQLSPDVANILMTR